MKLVMPYSEGSRVFVASLVLAFFVSSVPAATYIPDSPITGIVVPYQRAVKSYRSLAPRSADGGSGMAKSLNRDNHVMVSGPKGTPVSFADGAYPVYYMPGNVNGKFNGKISLLT